jgi:hypothetical protein
MHEKITIVSVGRHTRLGDVLERVVDGYPFQTSDGADSDLDDWTNQRILFAISGDDTGANESLHALTGRLLSGKRRLSGSVCAAIADGEQGGALHADVLKLLLAANGAGCAILNRPCVEASRDLKNISSMYGGRKGSAFERYGAHARALTQRLARYEALEATRAPLCFRARERRQGP